MLLLSMVCINLLDISVLTTQTKTFVQMPELDVVHTAVNKPYFEVTVRSNIECARR